MYSRRPYSRAPYSRVIVQPSGGTNVSLSAASAAATATSFGPTISLSLAARTSTAAAEPLVSQISLSLGAVDALGAEAGLAPSIKIPLGAESATGAAENLTPTISGTNVNLSAASAAGGAEPFTPSIAVPLQAAGSAASPGTIVANDNTALPAQAATAAVEALGIAASGFLVDVTGAAGFGTFVNDNIELFGVEATGAVAALTAIPSAPAGNPAYRDWWSPVYGAAPGPPGPPLRRPVSVQAGITSSWRAVS
jgi:hypothetical protein